MDTTNFIFGNPEHVDGVGLIHPIKLKDYDKFQRLSGVLYYSIQHFGDDYQKYPLLDLIVFGLKDEQLVINLESLLSIVTKTSVKFIHDVKNHKYGFFIDENRIVDNSNYDLVRKVIMQQNLMFEQKVYKNKLTQEWAEKAMKARAKNGIKMYFEDIISTVSAFSGKHYWDLQEYTIYQIQSDFNRIKKIKDYDITAAARCAGADVELNFFGEHVDLFRSPYDDLFVSKNKLQNLDNAMK